MKKLFNNKWLRWFCKLIIVILLSLLVSYYFALAREFLVPLTAILVMQTSAGNILRQGLQRFLLIILIVALASFLLQSMALFYARIYDVTLGAVIGILVNLFVFPLPVDALFREEVILILTAYRKYFSEIVSLLLKQKQENGSLVVANALQNFPNWVYKSGFDVALREGYRHFLLRIEQVGDVLFSLHYIARYQFDARFLQEISEQLTQCAKNVEDYFSALIATLELKKISEGVTDFIDNITSMEKEFIDYSALSLELLDIAKEDVLFAEFVYGLRDLHSMLSKLTEALR